MRGDKGSSTYPRTGVADKEMVAVGLRGVLGAGLARDVVAERADLALELARLVAAVNPVGNLGRLRLIGISTIYSHLLGLLALPFLWPVWKSVW